MSNIKRLAASFVPLVLIPISIVVGIFTNVSTQAAFASTPGCVSNGFCGNQQHFGDGLVIDVFHQAAQANNKVIAYPNSGTDRATDFIFRHPTSGPGVNDSSIKVFEYAPNGNPSGLCVADIGPGYGSSDAVVLRSCNNRQWQAWKPFSEGDGNYSWQNLATNQFLMSNGLRNQLTAEKDGVIGDPSNNKPDGSKGQLWKFIQQPATA